MWLVFVSFRLKRVPVPRKLVVLLLLLTSALDLRSGHAQAEEPTVNMTKSGGEIILKVPQFEAARERILKALAIQGAQLIDAKTLVNEKGRKHGWVTVRLAADRLPDA